MSNDKKTKNDATPTPRPPLLPHVKDETVLEPFRYINTVPGKDVRGKLIDCFQLWFRVESESVLQSIKEIIGDLHNASLLVDDIEDNSTLRRGIPVAHKVFGAQPYPSQVACPTQVLA